MSNQKKTKPIFEDILSEYLDGEIRKTALDFVAYLQAIRVKSEMICTIHLLRSGSKNSWAVALHHDNFNHTNRYEELIMSEEFQKIIFDNVVYCVYSSKGSGTGCSPNKPCAGGVTRMIFGQEIKNVCHFSRKLILIKNPVETEENIIKRLLELEKRTRNETPVKILKQAYAQTSEQNEISPYNEPKNTPCEIEDVAEKFLGSEKLKNLLDFTTWLRTNKISLRWATKNSWMVSTKGKRVCYIRVAFSNEIIIGSWFISFHFGGLANENLLSDGRLKEKIWGNVKLCKQCNSCFPGGKEIILGKEFENVCGLAAPEFWNPGAEELECAKQLIMAKRGL